MQFTLCNSLLLYALHSMHFALCTSLYALRSMHFTLCTSLYALHSMHFTLCTSLYALHSMHFTLCTSVYVVVSGGSARKSPSRCFREKKRTVQAGTKVSFNSASRPKLARMHVEQRIMRWSTQPNVKECIQFCVRARHCPYKTEAAAPSNFRKTASVLWQAAKTCVQLSKKETGCRDRNCSTRLIRKTFITVNVPSTSLSRAFPQETGGRGLLLLKSTNSFTGLVQPSRDFRMCPIGTGRLKARTCCTYQPNSVWGSDVPQS